MTKIVTDFAKNSEVQNRRDTSGADVSVLIIDKDPNFCGLGYLGPNASTAFAVVSYNCATGIYSFAHELGHLLGGSTTRITPRAHLGYLLTPVAISICPKTRENNSGRSWPTGATTPHAP